MNTRKKPESSADLEARVAALEATVANHADQLDAHEERIAELETAAPPVEPPPVEPPPTEPPPEGGTDQTLQQLVQNGGAVTLPKDSYNEWCTINSATQITGKPTTIDVTGLTISNQKAIFDAQKDLAISDLVLVGAKVPDQNGAGIRGARGANISLYDCEVTGCQMGILVSGGGADIEIVGCNFHDCGAADGQSHEIYCSAVNKGQYGETNFSIRDSDVISGAHSCHPLKVRATRIEVKNCTLKGSTSTDPNTVGSVVDLPDGGEVLIEDTEIEMMSTSPTSTILGYMTENTSQGVGTVTLRRVKIIDGRGRGGDLWCRSGAGGKLVLEDCTYTANAAPNLVGWGSVTGEFTKSSAAPA